MSQPRDSISAEEAGDCCAPRTDHARIARYFDRKTAAARQAGDFPPLANVSAALLAELSRDIDAARPTVLELGCGSGALTVALIVRGAERATGIDLSPAGIAGARERAATAGLDEARVTFSVGDAALIELDVHDWVVLDRSICCYADVSGLMANALGAARRRIAYTVPESRALRGLLNRAVWRVDNQLGRLRRNWTDGYVHDVRSIDSMLARAGFRPLFERACGMWRVAVFERV